jgi:hypothetical protein
MSQQVAVMIVRLFGIYSRARQLCCTSVLVATSWQGAHGKNIVLWFSPASSMVKIFDYPQVQNPDRLENSISYGKEGSIVQSCDGDS